MNDRQALLERLIRSTRGPTPRWIVRVRPTPWMRRFWTRITTQMMDDDRSCRFPWNTREK